MTTQIISTINNQGIVIIIDESGNKIVPIKPICEALGVAYPPQFTKIKEDEILGPTVTLSVTVGGDGKDRKMSCIPLKFVFGWLFTISEKNVSPDIKDKLLNYKMMCYDALYNYFTDHATFIELKERKLNEFVDKEAEARENFKSAEKLLREIRNERDGFRKLTFEEWKANESQLSLSLE